MHFEHPGQGSDPYAEKLITVIGKNTKEFQPFNQRISAICRLLKYTAIEIEPTDFTVYYFNPIRLLHIYNILGEIKKSSFTSDSGTFSQLFVLKEIAATPVVGNISIPVFKIRLARSLKVGLCPTIIILE